MSFALDASWVSAFLLAIIQGITEWIPVSSSGHLVLFQHILDYEADLLFDVALHFGTLMAVFVYFGKDIVDIIRDVVGMKFDSENGKTGILLIAASVPAAVIGFLFLEVFSNSFDNLILTAMGFAVTGLFLFIASFDFNVKKEILNWKDALLVGCAQALSILPGISRSGSTMASSMLLGLSPKAAARFSFLMAVPIIFGANILVVGNRTLPSELIWATLVSFLTGLLAIHVLFKYILTSKKNLRWFAAYALLMALLTGIYLIVY